MTGRTVDTRQVEDLARQGRDAAADVGYGTGVALMSFISAICVSPWYLCVAAPFSVFAILAARRSRRAVRRLHALLGLDLPA